MSFKIIHSCTSLSFSGLEQYVLELASWQFDTGHDVEIFCREGSRLAVKARKRGIPLWTILHKDKKGSPLCWARMAPVWSKHFKAACDQDKKIILHMHAGGEPWFHLPWITLQKKFIYKVILQHHLWITHNKKNPLHAAVYGRLDEIWCSSESAKAHLTTRLPVDRDKISVVAYGRDTQALQKYNDPAFRLKVKARIRSEFSIEPTAIVASTVSRIESIKGIGELFDAYVDVAESHPQFHLIIVGDVSPDNKDARKFHDKILQKHHQSSEKSRLHFTGYRSDWLDIVAASDFYILPSYEECMSLALLDALIIGVPGLGTNSGGTPSVVCPRKTGWLVEPKNSTALSAVLEQVLMEFKTASAAIQAYSLNAREIGRLFDREIIFKEILKKYEANSARLNFSQQC